MTNSISETGSNDDTRDKIQLSQNPLKELSPPKSREYSISITGRGQVGPHYAVMMCGRSWKAEYQMLTSRQTTIQDTISTHTHAHTYTYIHTHTHPRRGRLCQDSVQDIRRLIHHSFTLFNCLLSDLQNLSYPASFKR